MQIAEAQDRLPLPDPGCPAHRRGPAARNLRERLRGAERRRVFFEVSPVAGPPLGAVHATIDLRVGERDGFVAGEIVSEEEGRVRLRLTRAPQERPRGSAACGPAPTC